MFLAVLTNSRFFKIHDCHVFLQLKPVPSLTNPFVQFFSIALSTTNLSYVSLHPFLQPFCLSLFSSSRFSRNSFRLVRNSWICLNFWHISSYPFYLISIRLDLLFQHFWDVQSAILLKVVFCIQSSPFSVIQSHISSSVFLNLAEISSLRWIVFFVVVFVSFRFCSAPVL